MNHQLSYVATGDTINNQAIIIAAPAQSPVERLTAILDKLNEQKIVFKDSIRVNAEAGSALMHVLHITKNTRFYYAYIELYGGKTPLCIEDLPPQAVTAIIQRLKLVYAGKLKGK